MSKFGQLFKKTKIVQCPSCNQALRVPIKSGKTLQIKCQNCKSQFNIKMVNPLTSLITGKVKWTELPPKQRRQLQFIIFAVVFFVGMMIYQKWTTPAVSPPRSIDVSTPVQGLSL